MPRRLIAEAIDLVVFIGGRGSSRRIETIAEVAGLDANGDYAVDALPSRNCYNSERRPIMRTKSFARSFAATASSLAVLFACARLCRRHRYAVGSAAAADSRIPCKGRSPRSSR